MLRNQELKIELARATGIFAIRATKGIFLFKRIYCAVGLQLDYVGPGIR